MVTTLKTSARLQILPRCLLYRLFGELPMLRVSHQLLRELEVVSKPHYQRRGRPRRFFLSPILFFVLNNLLNVGYATASIV